MQYEVVTVFFVCGCVHRSYEMCFFLAFSVRFTTKRQSQIIAFVSIVYVFFLSCSMMSTTHMNSPASALSLSRFVYSFYYDSAVALADKYSVCLFISIGFLIYLHAVARVHSFCPCTFVQLHANTQWDWLTDWVAG